MPKLALNFDPQTSICLREPNSNSIEADVVTAFTEEECFGHKHSEIAKYRTHEWYLCRYPRLCAHVICESLGYATPLRAASIVKNAHEREEEWCEWVFSCYNRDPKIPVSGAFRHRRTHSGFMSEYRLAIALVRDAINNGERPDMFASWF